MKKRYFNKIFLPVFKKIKNKENHNNKLDFENIFSRISRNSK